MNRQIIAQELLVIARELIGKPRVAGAMPFDVGDTILLGRFKNRKAIVKGFGSGKHNQPTVITDKGTVPLFRFRVQKLMKD
jgi:hypothetical protein